MESWSEMAVHTRTELWAFDKTGFGNLLQSEPSQHFGELFNSSFFTIVYLQNFD